MSLVKRSCFAWRLWGGSRRLNGGKSTHLVTCGDGGHRVPTLHLAALLVWLNVARVGRETVLFRVVIVGASRRLNGGKSPHLVARGDGGHGVPTLRRGRRDTLL